MPAAAVTQANGRIRVEFSMRWYMRLPSLPLLAVSHSFGKRHEASGFAHEIGTALKLPAKDYVGTEPDENA
jgi:hypothetical protein